MAVYRPASLVDAAPDALGLNRPYAWPANRATDPHALLCALLNISATSVCDAVSGKTAGIRRSPHSSGEYTLSSCPGPRMAQLGTKCLLTGTRGVDRPALDHTPAN